MEGIIVGVLAALVIVQEIRIHRLVNRLLLQADVPQYLGPVRTTPPVAKSGDPVERVDTRKKLFSVNIPR